jgi:hypothetical protein
VATIPIVVPAFELHAHSSIVVPQLPVRIDARVPSLHPLLQREYTKIESALRTALSSVSSDRSRMS